MRIYEIAKEAGVTSADVLKAADAAGVDASSAISSVSDGDAGKLREALKGADASAAKAKRAEKRSKAAELNAQFFAEQRVKLDEHLRIAKEAAEKKVEKRGGGGQWSKFAFCKSERPRQDDEAGRRRVCEASGQGLLP